ncbi:hypothetical protein V6Z12_D11G109700 [Gossypium hirsutum]
MSGTVCVWWLSISNRTLTSFWNGRASGENDTGVTIASNSDGIPATNKFYFFGLRNTRSRGLKQSTEILNVGKMPQTVDSQCSRHRKLTSRL